MTDRASWPLLADLDALLSREGWQEDAHAMEMRIAAETGIGRRCVARDESGEFECEVVENWVEFYEVGSAYPGDRLDCQTFLRSRDAAAMLEEAVHEALPNAIFAVDVHKADDRWPWASIIDMETIGAVIQRASTEPAARTRAALEAGFRLGLWPVR